MFSIKQRISPVVTICVDLEGGLSRSTVMAEQFLESNDTGNGERDLASDQSLASDGRQRFQGNTSNHADGGENSQQQVR